MGSNANRQGDYRHTKEWGKKARKEEERTKKSQFRAEAIRDELEPGTTYSGPRRKKDTKRWCRGKEGREHNYVLKQRNPNIAVFGWSWTRYECEGCGRRKWT